MALLLLQASSLGPFIIHRLANRLWEVQIHGNVCMAAVVVTEQLDWRLHGFDLLSEHGGGGFDWPLTAASWMV